MEWVATLTWIRWQPSSGIRTHSKVSTKSGQKPDGIPQTVCDTTNQPIAKSEFFARPNKTNTLFLNSRYSYKSY
jgi:hypothetical protein